MKNHIFHINSFLLGILAGAFVLILLATSLPYRTEVHTYFILQNQTDHFKISTSRSFEKAWSQIRVEMSLIQWQIIQKIIKPISQWFNKSGIELRATFHKTPAPICSELKMFNQVVAQLLSKLNLHIRPWSFLSRPPRVPSVPRFEPLYLRLVPQPVSVGRCPGTRLCP